MLPLDSTDIIYDTWSKVANSAMKEKDVSAEGGTPMLAPRAMRPQRNIRSLGIAASDTRCRVILHCRK
jgi:hypothetical protein